MGSETHTQTELGRDLEGTHIVADGHRDTQRKTEIGGIHRNGFREGGETKTVSHSHAKSRIPRDKEKGMWGDMGRDSGGHGVAVVQPTHHSVLLE